MHPLFNRIRLKASSTCCFGIETAVQQNYSTVYQKGFKKIGFLAYTMPDAPNFNKPLPLSSVASHQFFEVVRFSEQLNPLRNAPFKLNNKPTEVRYEISTQD